MGFPHDLERPGCCNCKLAADRFQRCIFLSVSFSSSFLILIFVFLFIFYFFLFYFFFFFFSFATTIRLSGFCSLAGFGFWRPLSD